MLEIGVSGVDPDAFAFDDVRDEIEHATPLRVFAIARALRDAIPVAEIARLSGIDPWFINGVQENRGDARDAQIRGHRRSRAPAPGKRARLRRCRDRRAVPGSPRARPGRRGAPTASFAGSPGSTPPRRSSRPRPTTSTPPSAPRRDEAGPVGPAQDHRRWLRALPDRLQRRVRLVLRQRGPGRRRGRFRDHHGQLQPRNREHRLRRVRQAGVRRDHLRIDSRPLRAGKPARHRAQHGRAVAQQPGDRSGRSRGAHPGHLGQGHRPCRGPPEILFDARPAGHRPAALDPCDQPGSDRRGGRRAWRLSGAGAAVLCAERGGDERRPRAARARAHPRPRICRQPAPSGGGLEVRDPRPRGRNRRGRRPGQAGALCDKRAYRGRWCPFRRCDVGPAAATALH